MKRTSRQGSSPGESLDQVTTFSDVRVAPTPSAPDTRYGLLTCTTSTALNAGSEFRLPAAVGGAPDVARGPRALKGGCPLQTRVRRIVENDSPLSATASRSVEPTLSLKNLEILPTTPMLPQRGNIGGQPQAGAGRTPALSLQPETCPPSLPDFAPHAFFPALSKPDFRHPHEPAARRSRKAKQGGAGGIISPALPFLRFLRFLRFRGPGRRPGCSCLSPSTFLSFYSLLARYCPVRLSGVAAMRSGEPVATMVPPA